MAFAKLSIDLEARLATFEQQLGRAAKVSETQAKRMAGALATVRTAAGALGATVAAALSVEQLSSSIDKLATLDVLAEKLGATTEQLSALQYAGQLAGTDAASLADGLTKLARAADTGNKGLDAMGIATRGANGALRPLADLLGDVAGRFASYENGTAKAALAQEVFGESGSRMIPILNLGRAGIADLADEAQRLGAVVDGEAAVAARQFGDNLARLHANAEALKTQLAVQLLPTLTATSEAFVRNARDAGLFVGAIRTISEGLAARLGLDEQGQLQRQARAQVIEMEALGNQIERLAELAAGGDTGAAARVEKLRGQLQALQREAGATSNKLKGLADDLVAKATPAALPTAKLQAPTVKRNLPAGSSRPQQDQSAAQFQRFLERIQQQGSLARGELVLQQQTGEKLAASDRTRLQLLGELETASNRYSRAQQRQGAAAVDKLVQDLQALEAMQARNQLEREAAQLAERDAQQRSAEAAGIRQQTTVLQDYLAELGLTADQLDNLRAARGRHAVEQQQEALATLALNGATQEQITAQRQLVAALQSQADAQADLAARRQDLSRSTSAGSSRAVQDYLDEIKAKGDAAYGVMSNATRLLEDDLTGLFRNGRLETSRLVDYMIDQFLRLQVVKPLMADLFGSSTAGSSGGFLAAALKLFGFADGGAFGAPTQIKAFADGGVFNSPHLFKFADGGAMQMGVLGEAGPEAVMPLKRGPDGRLGVEVYRSGIGTDGRSPAPTIHQTVTVGDGVSISQVKAAMEVTKATTIAAIRDMQRRGQMA